MTDDAISELLALFSFEYPSDKARRKAVYKFLVNHHGLSLALMKTRKHDDAFRAKYRRCIKETCIILVAMVYFMVVLFARYSANELDEIWASEQLRWGFLFTMAILLLSMSLAIIWAFGARAILHEAVYEQLLHIQTNTESAEYQNRNTKL